MPKPGGCHPSGSSLGDARSRLAWLEYACGANVLGRKLLAGQTAGQRLGNKAHSAGAMWALRAPDFDNRLARTRGATLAARRNAERQPAEKDRGGVPAPIASRSLADLRPSPRRRSRCWPGKYLSSLPMWDICSNSTHGANRLGRLVMLDVVTLPD